MKKRNIVFVTAAILVCLVVFRLLYLYDNKYTYHTSHNNPSDFTYLINGWEFYQHKLFTPADLENNNIEPDCITWIGEYSGFNLDNLNESHYGSATYRLLLHTTKEAQSYTLELPEIFSAYHLWINGVLVAQYGNPEKDTYMPEVAHSSISFTASEKIEILFAVSNFDHYYSGITYPPAFGLSKAVNKVLNTATIVATIRCVFALLIGLFYVWAGILLTEKKLPLSFGALCFFYAGSVSHQLVRTLELTSSIWYVIEDMSFYLLLAGYVYVSGILFPEGKMKRYILRKYIPFIGTMVGLLVVTSSIWLDNVSIWGNILFALTIKGYKIMVICCLIVISVKAVKHKDEYSAAMLSAVCIFTISLIIDTAFRLYEPIHFGWPTENGGFVMVVTLGIVILFHVVHTFRERILLDERNQQLTTSYESLSSKIEQTAQINHDIKHHVAILNDFIIKNDMESIANYLKTYEKDMPMEKDLYFSDIPAIDSVLRYYHKLATQQEIDITYRVRLPDISNHVFHKDICVLLGNMLENAIEACNRMKDSSKESFIRLFITYNQGYVMVVCDNSFDGKVYQQNGVFYSRKRKEYGIGTSSIQSIADKYNGHVEFKTKENRFEASVFLHYL